MRQVSLILSLLALSAFVNCASIIWVLESLDGEIGHPDFEDEKNQWGSTDILELLGQKTIKIQSTTNKSITKAFSTSVPHAKLIVQAQFFETGCLKRSEGFRMKITHLPNTIERYESANELNGCQEGQINVYTQRYSIPQRENDFQVQFTSIFDVEDGSKTISLNHLKIGVIGCPDTCAKCHLPTVEDPNGNDDDDETITVCDECPENASFDNDQKACHCNEGFKSDKSNGYLVCIKDNDVDDGEISSACRLELNNYAQRNRVNVFATEEDGAVHAHVDHFHFFSVISEECAKLIRIYVLHYDNDSSEYQPLAAKYISHIVVGDYVDIIIPENDFSTLANTVNHEDGKDIYSIRLALQFKVGSSVARVHDFDLIYQINQDHSHSVSAFNEDYQLNMNFISPISYFNNPPAFVKEYLFDIKRYLCVDETCVLAREFQGYNLHERILVKIQYKSNQNKQHLSLFDAHVFGNNQQFEVLHDVSVVNDGEGFLILSLNQDYITTTLNNQQATNKAYLQFTVTYHDDPADPSSKLRYGQAVILFFALFTNPL